MIRKATALACAAFLIGTTVQAATIYGLPDDGTVNEDGLVTDRASDNHVHCDPGGFRRDGWDYGHECGVCLPVAHAPEGLGFMADASFRVYHYGRDGTPSFNADVYGLGYRTSPALLAGDYFTPAANTIYDADDATLIQDNFLLPAAGSQGYSTSGSALSAYLNAQYEASAADRQNGPVYVFLRLNPDVDRNGNYTRYKLCVAENTDANRRPSLTYVAGVVPEPTSIGIIGGLAAFGLVRRRRGAVRV